MKAVVYNDDIDLFVSSEEMSSIGYVKFPGMVNDRPKLETTTKTGERILFERGPTDSWDGIEVKREGNEFLVRFRTSMASYFRSPGYRPILTRYRDMNKINLYNSDFLPPDLQLLFEGI